MNDDVTNWTELREFAAVDLEQSFVVAWEADRESMLVDLDLYLKPEHTFYEQPRPAEGACFRPAVIEFPYCTLVAESGKARIGAVTETLESLPAGRISGFRRIGDGQYEMKGTFGTVRINAERPLLRLKEPFV